MIFIEISMLFIQLVLVKKVSCVTLLLDWILGLYLLRGGRLDLSFDQHEDCELPTNSGSS